VVILVAGAFVIPAAAAVRSLGFKESLGLLVAAGVAVVAVVALVPGTSAAAVGNCFPSFFFLLKLIFRDGCGGGAVLFARPPTPFSSSDQVFFVRCWQS
jgi:hypothetical protein